MHCHIQRGDRHSPSSISAWRISFRSSYHKSRQYATEVDVISWRANLWCMLAGQTVLGAGRLCNCLHDSEPPCFPVSKNSNLRELFEFRISLGISILGLVEHMALPLPPTHNSVSITSRVMCTGTLIRIRVLSRMSRDLAQSTMKLLLFWTWKGVVYRSLIASGPDMTLTWCRHLHIPESTLSLNSLSRILNLNDGRWHC